MAEAPEDIVALAAHWQALRGGDKCPSRDDIDPAALRRYLGFISILEVRDDPVDFVYRLFGSKLVECLQLDMTGKSVLDLPPAELGQCIFQQMRETIGTSAPIYFRAEVRCDNPSRKSGFARLVLPLSGDGVTIDRILSYTRFDAAPLDFWSHFAH